MKTLRCLILQNIDLENILENVDFPFRGSKNSNWIKSPTICKRSRGYSLNVALPSNIWPMLMLTCRNSMMRYVSFRPNGDMLSVTGYFKYLESPIERIQELNGGATLHSFRNADNGIATGVEVEFRKELIKNLKLGANASYMYTNVKLPQGGAYSWHWLPVSDS